MSVEQNEAAAGRRTNQGRARGQGPEISQSVATGVLLGAAVLFGLTPYFAKLLQAEGVGSAAIALYRYVFSAILLLPFLPLAREKRGQALLLGGAGMAMGVAWIGYLEAIKTATIAAAGVVYMSYPLFAAVLAWALAGQRLGLRALGAGVLILAAAVLALDPSALGEAAAAALIWSLPAPIAFAFIIVVLTAMTPSLSVAERMACGLGGSALGLAPLALLDPAAATPSTAIGWAMVAVFGLCTALGPQLLYTYAAPRVSAARAAAAGAVELPTMLAVAALAFGETIGPREIAAAILIGFAVSLAPADPGPTPAARRGGQSRF